MIIKIHGPTKLARIKIPDITELDRKIKSEFDADGYTLYSDKAMSRQIGIADIRDGDILYIKYEIKGDPRGNKSAPSKVDLSKMHEGGIRRQRDRLLCQHGDKGMCSNCAPLDVWDKDYHMRMGIKYISYRSYLQMIGKDHEDVRLECNHSRNAKCVHCMPKKVTLKPQQFRTCDHIEFDSQKIVEEFLKSARGKERFGFLIGQYRDYERVPLGIKALVSAIYEPEQDNFPDGFFVNDLEPEICMFLEKIKMEVVGMIYTNLNSESDPWKKNNKGKMEKDNNKSNIEKVNMEKNNNKSNIEKDNNKSNMEKDKACADCYIPSALEISFIASFQKLFSEDTHSKFITAVATRTKNDEITIEPFMISHQGQVLITENKILPTLTTKFYNKNYKSAPIAYSCLNESNLVVEKIDKFIPSEYFIVKPTQGYRENPVFRDCRSVGALSKKKIWQYFEGDYTFSRFANFSLLFRIYKDSNAQEFQKDASLEDTLGFKENFKMKTADLDLLVDSVMKNDELEFTKFQLSDSYGRIKKMLDRYSDSWTCSRCTFINKSNLNECEMCMLPRY